MKLSEKIKYVAEQKNDGLHTCHWPECQRQIPAALLMCTGHWFTLPQSLRDKVWEEYRPGQEIDKKPSRKYILVVKEVLEWIEKHLKDKEKKK